MVYNRYMETMEQIENIIVDNVLSDEDIKNIYDIVNSTDFETTIVQRSMGHRAYLVSLGEDIRLKLEKTIQDIYGQDWILNAYQFARYTTEWGYQLKLYPHFDDAFEDHKLTLDVQIKGTKPWPIVIEGNPITLKNNQGLVFSGTDQIHWREYLDFDSNDYFDMIFCHFTKVNDPRGKVTKEWIDKMSIKEKYWKEKCNIPEEAIEL